MLLNLVSNNMGKQFFVTRRKVTAVLYGKKLLTLIFNGLHNMDINKKLRQ